MFPTQIFTLIWKPTDFPSLEIEVASLETLSDVTSGVVAPVVSSS